MKTNASSRYAATGLPFSLARSLEAVLFVSLSALLTIAAATSFVEDAALAAAAEAIVARPAATQLAAHQPATRAQ